MSPLASSAAGFASSAQGLVNQFQKWGQFITLKQGTEFRDQWLKAFPNILRWQNTCRQLVRQGEDVVMVDGRRRQLIGDKAQRVTNFCNNTVQGSCASAMKLALYGIHKNMPAIDPAARLVAVVHDEVLIQCTKGKGEEIMAMAKEQMLQAGAEIFGPEVPFTSGGSVGHSWGDAH